MPLLVYPLMGMVVQKMVLQSITAPEEVAYHLGFDSKDQAEAFSRLLEIGNQSIRLEKETESSPASDSSQDSIQDEIRAALAERPEPKILYFESEGQEWEELVLEGKIDLAVIVGSTREEPTFRFIYDAQNNFSLTVLRYVQKRIRYANEQMVKRIIADHKAPLPMPVTLREFPVEAKSRRPILLTFVPLMLVLMTITGAVYPAIDLTAGERERGTMEILVAAPVSRLSVLCGKFIAVLAVALLTAVANLVAMTVTIFALGLDPLIFNATNFNILTLLVIFVLLVVLAAFFSATLLCLTSFARSFKEAQAYLIPLMLVAFAPGLLSLNPELETSALLSVIPLVNVVVTGRDLLAGEASPIFVAIAVCSTAIYGVMALSLAAKIFGMDSILTGGKSSWSDLLARSQAHKRVADMQTTMLFLALLFPAFVVFAGVSSNLAGKLGFSIASRLWMNAVVTMLLFLGLPLLFCKVGKFRFDSAFFLFRPSLLSVLAAVLLGASVWVLAYELEVFSLTENRLVEFVKMFESMKVELGQIPLWIKLICLAVVPAVCEEFTFRGFLLSAFRDKLTAYSAVILTAVLFGLFHVFVRNTLMIERLVPSTFMGLLLGWMCLRSGSLFPGILLHALHNGLLMTLAHYEAVLIKQGWGLDEQQHLPWNWVLLALVPIAVGFAVMLSMKRVKRQNDEDVQ